MTAAGTHRSRTTGQTPTTAARPWRPGALVTGSLVLHAVGLLLIVAALAGTPQPWHKAAFALVATALIIDHVVLTLTGLWPRSTWLGANLRHLDDIRRSAALAHLAAGPAATRHGPWSDAIALTIDDGPDPDVTPRVLDLLKRFDARATFFLIGENAVAHPALVHRLLADGHAIGNHTATHAHDFSLRGMRRLTREIALAQQQLDAGGHPPPRFFRAPAGLRNPFLDPVLCRLGLTLCSWTRRGFDTTDRDADRIAARLLGRDGDRWGTRLRAGDILLVHDGHAARDDTGEPVVLAVLERVLGTCRDHRLAVRSLDELIPANRFR